MNTRTAALVCVIATAVGACYAVLLAIGVPDPTWGFGLRTLIHLGELAGVVAVALAGAIGAGILGRVGVGTAVIGQVLLAVAELVFEGNPAVGEQLFNVAPLLSMIGMVLAGIGVLRAGQWSGWARFTPLAVGLWMLVVVTPVMLTMGPPPATAAIWALAGWDLCWLLLGVSALTQTARTRAPAKA
jgi:hypothetical protein